MLKVIQQLGPLTVEATGEREQEIFEKLDFWTRLPSQCGVCAAPVGLACRRTTGGNYYLLRCTSQPAHEAQVRQHKPANGGGLYFRADEQFELEWAARNAQSSGYDEPPDNNGQQQRPDREARDSFNSRDELNAPGVAATEQGNGGPTSGQRTLMSKLLTDMGLTLEQAYAATGATKKWEEMNAGQAARFIDAVKNIKREVAF